MSTPQARELGDHVRSPGEHTPVAGESCAADEAPASGQCRRARVRVQGTVQGVGFRPYVYRIARELGLGGFVLNDSRGVLLEVEGTGAAVARFLERLAPEAPPLAVLERVAVDERRPAGERAFAIRESPRAGAADAPVTPDTATCADCLRELFDATDRRFRYPFINCTNCGPRFTIVCGIPYDRPLTTMARFRMCAHCRAEYADPADRRFHAQPNACPRCGPTLSLLRCDGGPAAIGAAADTVAAAADALRAGQIVAVKGIGGYHLACRADDELVVARLRARKHREHKPFALMVSSLRQASALVRLGARERALLRSPERPIVLAARLHDAPVAPSVAPRAPELGVMLPYSPLHHLLLSDLDGLTLVMTSGNLSEEPIAYRDGDARERLAQIADLLLVHDRPIQTRTDDSVARVVALAARPRPLFLRRSRGYVPASLRLPIAAAQPLLACGAELKNTFCVARCERAWVSHHIGDLQNFETLSSFAEGVAHFERLFTTTPAVLAHDLHPEYMSSKYALAREGVDLIGVQHHHAHMAACLAEHGELGTAVGAVFDGTGYGSDGSVWGGELLVGDLAGFRRLGTIMPVRMPGGDRAISEPWRMACSWLVAAVADDADDAADAADAAEGGAPALPPALAAHVQQRHWGAVAALARSGVSSPLTSSAGRLFDAVAALCGLRARVNYEGQAAIELEAACDPHERGRYPIALVRERELTVIDPRETIRALAADVGAGVSVGAIASRFHAALAHVTVRACAQAADAEGSELVVLSGGVFANRRLLGAVAAGLDACGLRVLVPERLPPGDGGISFGQAAVAARLMAR